MVVNKYLAEFLGTFVLVFFGSMGILAVGGAVGAAEIVAISFAFGLALLAGIWAVAHVSGAHFNPAVTLAMLIETFGHEAEVAFDGPSAVARARALAPDVVLCDIGLPGLTGYDVARALRAGGALLVAVSGYAQPEDVARAMEAGFHAHVPKPPDLGEIERLLAAPRAPPAWQGGPGAPPPEERGP